MPEDTDGDPSDNLSGTEVFDAGLQVDANGDAFVAGTTTLLASAYQVELGVDPIILGPFTFDSTSELRFEGTVTASANDGLLGMAIRTDALVAALNAAGQTQLATSISGLSDLDLDQDGTNESISAAFTYTSVPCGLVSGP